MRRSLKPLLALLAPLALTFCSDDNSNSVNPPVNGAVSVLDQCDPTTFNAALGAGACAGSGTVTLDAFTAELSASHTVAAWRFDPATLSITVGGIITATNNGGEEHTFTEVAAFGGGIVPALNTASGNPIEAPECMNLDDDDHIKPGASYKTEAETAIGTRYYQCCIHPWMRSTVTVGGT